MGANKITFTDNNSLLAIGNYRIISYSDAFYGVERILGVEDIVVGIPAGAILERSFRWSKDGKSWSLWMDYEISNQTPLTSIAFNPSDKLYIEFRYLIADDPNQSPELEPGTPISPVVVIESFDFMVKQFAVDPYINYTPATQCSDEFGKFPILSAGCGNFTFNPYKVNSAINMYGELSNMVNQTFGHEVNYFRVTPQMRSADVVFKDWTLKESMHPKCFKILVPNNEFPDSKPNYSGFDVSFEVPFEIHIDKGYWESVFGKNTMPQHRDYLYFPMLNRMYEVQSTYAFRDFMQKPLYYKVQLIKYQNRADVLKDEDLQTMLDEATLSTEELFGEDMQKEIERHTKPQQYVTVTHEQDPTRAKVNRSVPIPRYDLYNNWTVIAEHYYDLAQVGTNAEAVIYRAPSKMSATDSRAFTCWFSPVASQANQPTRPLLRGRNQSGIGMDIDLVYYAAMGQSQIKITLNSNTTIFQMTGVQLDKDSWYGVVVNVSNEFAQASVDLWVMQPNESALKRVYHKALPITTTVYDAAEPWKLISSALLLTNIRLFDRMIPDESQSLVLTQLIVKDSDKVIIIDNSLPLLRLPRIAPPR